MSCPGNEIECWHPRCRWPDCTRPYALPRLALPVASSDTVALLARAAQAAARRQYAVEPELLTGFGAPSAFGVLG